jgi:predicted DNA-binding transcriptional regulator AlpA
MNLLTKEEVCKSLHISPRCLENWVAEGRFPAPQRIGRCNYWAEGAMERWFELTFAAQNNWRPGLSSTMNI